jgi:hypothetical protein
MRLNSKEVKKAINLHLLDIVDLEEVKNDLEEVKIYIVSRYIKEFHDKRVNIQDNFIQWLNGLSLNTLYYTNDIIEYLHSIGLYGKSKKQEEEKASFIYHYLIFSSVKDILFNEL